MGTRQRARYIVVLYLVTLSTNQIEPYPVGWIHLATLTSSQPILAARTLSTELPMQWIWVLFCSDAQRLQALGVN